MFETSLPIPAACSYEQAMASYVVIVVRQDYDDVLRCKLFLHIYTSK